MTELITYRGGSCGDFIRTLLTNCEHRVDDNGKLYTDDMFDFTRPLRELIEIGDNINSIISKGKRFKERHRLHKRTDYITSHDFTVFVTRFGDGKEFFRYVDELEIKRVLFVSITTIRSLRIRTINSMIKNHNKTYEQSIELFDKYYVTQLQEYQNDAKIYLDFKRNSDIILELECIYDKEYLRNFLLENYNWSDSNYDAIYDAYMSKQPRIGD